MELKFHPAADLLPLLAGQEFKDLVDSIRAQGQLDDIEVLAGTDEIIDGRNRYRACLEADVEPRIRQVAEESMPHGVYEYVIAKNVTRRQLTEDQRAQVAMEALPHLEKEAAARKAQAAGQPRGAKKEASQASDTGQEKRRAPTSTERAAQAVGVSDHKVRQAKEIYDFSPELAAEVKAGTKTARDARKEMPQEAKDKKPLSAKRQADNAAQVVSESLAKISLEDILSHWSEIPELSQRNLETALDILIKDAQQLRASLGGDG